MVLGMAAFYRHDWRTKHADSMWFFPPQTALATGGETAAAMFSEEWAGRRPTFRSENILD